MNDYITITWHIDDVLAIDDTLTKSQAKEVLQLLKKNHNPSVGINWDVIQDTIMELD